MTMSEAPLDESIASNLAGAAAEGAQLVGTSVDAEPAEIVQAINGFLEKAPKSGWIRKVDNWTDRALPVGSLWGTAIARRFGWHWAGLTQGDFKAIAVVSEDRSLAIFAFHYVFGCLENQVPPTVLLAFNMLEGHKIPKQPPGAYVNLMDGVQHIVPPS